MGEMSNLFDSRHEAALDMVNEYASRAEDDGEEKIMLIDGFEEALVGMAFRFGGVQAAAYDVEKILQILQGRGMSEEEAVEFFDFNIIGAWVGSGTPIFVHMPKLVDIRPS